MAETRQAVAPLTFVADVSVDFVSLVDASISNPPRGGVFGTGSLADLDDVNYLYLWGTHTGDNFPPGLDAFAYSVPAALPSSGVVSVLSASLTFQAKLLDFPDGIVILRDTGEVMTYTDWPGTPDAQMATLAGQATAQDMHFVFDDAPDFDLSAEVNTFEYAPSVIPLDLTGLDWSTAHTLTIFAWDGNTAHDKPTAQLRLTQAFVTITYTYADPTATTTVTRRHLPPARLSGRMDGLGPLSGSRRLDTIGPSRQSGFHPGSPGSYY